MDRKKRTAAIHKEMLRVKKQEEQLFRHAQKVKKASWKTELEQRIPEKVYKGLESAFAKGFSLVFQQGRSLIERSYNKEEILKDHSIRDFAVQLKGGRRELKQIQKGASKSGILNLTVTTVEGIALGALGVGMPDIVLFLSMLLKGIYEAALNYGFTYESKQEQYLILKMMETALTTGGEWGTINEEVDRLMIGTQAITEEDFAVQLQKTAAVFAMDMLLLKFVQGIPVVGILGGAANPVYYSRVMRYVQLKYRKRYLVNLQSSSMDK